MSVEGGYGRASESGWSGSDTSRERAERESASGVAGKRQRQVLEAVAERRFNGLTCGEVESKFGIGHGAASAALTTLHRAGRVVRLRERRGQRAEIYVVPEWVAEREESPYRPNRTARRHPREFSRLEVLTAMSEASVGEDSYEAVRAVLENLPND